MKTVFIYFVICFLPFNLEAYDHFERVFIEGYASYYQQVDRLGDRIRPGAFEASVALFNSGQLKIKMLYQHDPSKIIGVWTHLIETEKGLYVKGYIDPELPQGLKYIDSLASTDEKLGLSIGYRALKAQKDGEVRTLKKVELTEISITADPVLETGFFKVQAPNGFYQWSCTSLFK